MRKFFKPPALSTSFSHNGKLAKNRFENILSAPRKRGKSIAALAVCLTAAASALASCTNEAASIGIIGGADGPTAVYIAKNIFSGSKNDTVTADITEELYNAKIQYLGDASGVGKIKSLLPFGADITYGGMEMNTTDESFGVTIYYTDENDTVSENDMENNAAVMFALIENCSNITFKNKDTGGNMTFTRTDEDKRFDMTLAQYSENLDNFRQLMTLLTAGESYAQVTNDTLVSKAILQRNPARYALGECAAEGHIILGEDSADGNKIIYALTTYGAYGFENSKFVKLSGSGVIPIRMTFDSQNNLIEYKEPMDGGYFNDSIKENFPKEYHDRILYTRKTAKDTYESDYEICLKQEHEYARAYLQSINHAEREISDGIDWVMPEISAEASNALSEIYYEYPYWIGTMEKIEDGIRYVYETDWKDNGNGNGVVTYRKYEYISKKTVEEFAVNVQGKNIELISVLTTPKLDRLGNEHQ